MNLGRKCVPVAQVLETVEDYARWMAVKNALYVLRAGLHEMERWKLSWRDALVLAAAKRTGATRILSEDLNEGQDYDGILAVNR